MKSAACILALTLGFANVLSAATPPVRALKPRVATPASALKGLAFDAPLAKLKPLAASMQRVHVPKALELPAGQTAMTADTSTTNNSTTSLYQAGLTLSPYFTRETTTLSYAVMDALVIVPEFSARTKNNDITGSAICLAGRFNHTSSDQAMYGSYVFRKLPAGTHTYMVTFSTNLTPAFIALKVGNSVIPPAAILHDGVVHRALVQLAPSADAMSAASVVLSVKGAVTNFNAGPVKLQLID